MEGTRSPEEGLGSVFGGKVYMVANRVGRSNGVRAVGTSRWGEKVYMAANRVRRRLGVDA